MICYVKEVSVKKNLTNIFIQFHPVFSWFLFFVSALKLWLSFLAFLFHRVSSFFFSLQSPQNLVSKSSESTSSPKTNRFRFASKQSPSFYNTTFISLVFNFLFFPPIHDLSMTFFSFFPRIRSESHFGRVAQQQLHWDEAQEGWRQLVTPERGRRWKRWLCDQDGDRIPGLCDHRRKHGHGIHTSGRSIWWVYYYIKEHLDRTFYNVRN